MGCIVSLNAGNLPGTVRVQRTVSCVFVKTKRGGSSRYAYAGVLRSYWRRFGDRVLHCFDASHVYLGDRFFTHERNQSDHPRQASRPPQPSQSFKRQGNAKPKTCGTTALLVGET